MVVAYHRLIHHRRNVVPMSYRLAFCPGIGTVIAASASCADWSICAVVTVPEYRLLSLTVLDASINRRLRRGLRSQHYQDNRCETNLVLFIYCHHVLPYPARTANEAE